MEILKELNPEQKKAVQHNQGPLLILAGAGSGKTRVLTHRIAYLIHNYGVNPANILAVTFTNKAANEMEERVNKLINKDGRAVWMSTFHSMCVRILRKESAKLDYDSNFVIFDTTDQKKLIKNVLRDLDIDVKKYAKKCLYRIGDAKNELVGPEDFTAKNYKEEMVEQVYPEYQKRLKENNAFDFGDLIMQTVKLFLDNPLVLDYYQEKFKYIMVDEYQDVNHAQYELVNLLSQKYNNICVVGDDDQGIYGFRGADISNILNFEEDYPNTEVIKLEQNYRSTKNILDAAYNVVANNLGRKEKKLWTDNPEGAGISLYQAKSGQDEAEYIVDNIKRLKEEDKSLDDFAILYRTNAQSRSLEDKLRKANLPYRIIGGFKFYERKEIQDVLSYLRVLYNPVDDVSLERIINQPSRGIGPATLERLKSYANLHNLNLLEVVNQVDQIETITTRFSNKVNKFGEMISYLISRKDELSIVELTKELLEESNYIDSLREKNTEEAKNRIDNIKELLSDMEEFVEENDPAELGDYLENVALIAGIDNLDESQEAVVLMTLHSAKGLEFPVVFLAGMEEEYLPHGRSMGDEEEIAEERRLCYVGITRAEEKLFLTNANSRQIYGRFQSRLPSRFLRDIPDELFASEEDEAVVEQMQEVNYKAGDKVIHPHWGAGTVVGFDQTGDLDQVTVTFPDQGIKKLAIEYTDLTKTN
ncbi:MAG: DNA helicase PcrA [Bacillota bacterium]